MLVARCLASHAVQGAAQARRGGVGTARTVAAKQLPSWNKSVLDRWVKRAFERADSSRRVVAHSGVVPHLPQLDGTDSHLWFGWRHGESEDLADFAAVCRVVNGLRHARLGGADRGRAFLELLRRRDQK